jgi:1-acyl-sn-glycerol-3-phosphate acyltransferase
LVIFPEGTRFDRSKLARSDRYAEMAGISKLDHVLAPHTTGFETILNVNRDIFQAVYDVTIIYEGKDGLVMAPDMFGFYSGSCRKVHICLNRIDIKDVPYTNEEQRQWLYRTFQFKDKIINEFRLNGNMNAHYKRHLPLPLSYTMPYTVVYGVLLALMSTTKYGRICWITTFITYSLLGYIFIKCKT